MTRIQFHPYTRTVIEDPAAPLTPAALYAAAAFDWLIVAPAASIPATPGSTFPADAHVTLRLDRERNQILMLSPLTGSHRLNADAWATDPERLAAHWHGFVANNRLAAIRQLRAEVRL